MASGILGGGSLTMNANVNPYTTPTNKVTTATLVLASSSSSGSCEITFGPFTFTASVPNGGLYTMSGVILGSGQAVRLKSYSTTLSYMLTGWESTE